MAFTSTSRLLTVCRKGKHKLEGTNVYVERNGRRRCRACLKIKQYRRRKTRDGYCKKRMHRMTEANTTTDGRCKRCKYGNALSRYRAGRLISIACAYPKCHRSTRRSSNRAGSTFVCRFHKEDFARLHVPIGLSLYTSITRD